MPEPEDDICISEEPDALGFDIEARLLQVLRKASKQAENRHVVLSARGAEGRLVGGLVASTSYGWLFVKVLWVAEDHRGRAVGRRLMQGAEERAGAIGCHGAWLDTSSPDAKRFYEKLGYKAFAHLANGRGQHPEGHHRWFMEKALVS